MTVVMLGMTGGAYAAEFSDLAVKAAVLRSGVAAEGVAVPAVSRAAGVLEEPVEFITIPGGRFIMGSESGHHYAYNVGVPMRTITVKTFEMSKTAVTVEQYAECVAQGACTEPDKSTKYCNWRRDTHNLHSHQLWWGGKDHPINCVSWNQAQEYARFKGARLPSEAEWEYAARSGGKGQVYPWGNDDPTIQRDQLEIPSVCGIEPDTHRVCLHPAGNTAHGLCDMVGSVMEWVQDMYKDSYVGAPTDGSAVEGLGNVIRAVRGGKYNKCEPNYLLRVDSRYGEFASDDSVQIGFRLARSR